MDWPGGPDFGRPQLQIMIRYGSSVRKGGQGIYGAGRSIFHLSKRGPDCFGGRSSPFGVRGWRQRLVREVDNAPSTPGVRRQGRCPGPATVIPTAPGLE